jgi:hypothetical protein
LTWVFCVTTRTSSNHHQGCSCRHHRDGLRVLQELAPKDPDAIAVQHTRFDDLNEEQRAAIEAIGKKGYVVVRERKRGVIGLGYLKPAAVVQRVSAQSRSCST